MIEFDLLYDTYIKSTDFPAIEKAVKRMVFLQNTIINSLKNNPTHISISFKNNTNRKITISNIDVARIERVLQEKLTSMLMHTAKVSSLSNRVDPITLPSSSTRSDPLNLSPPKATDFAVGFANLSANCWANSLLSMILSMPNFKRAYETVANHYAQDNLNPENQLHGQALLNVLAAYEGALTLKQSLPASVSQSVRLAFNHFFGQVNPFTSHEIFSKNPSCDEDASEAMQILMGRYEQITRQGNGPLPRPYSSLQTKRHYRPIGTSQPADPEKLRRDDYSRLTVDHVSSVVHDDYQIILDLQNKGHLSFSTLLSEYFRNTHLQGNDTGTYLLPDGQIQQFELIGEGRQFVHIPDELLLTVKRFGATLDGRVYKIAMPLAIHQTLILPAAATSANVPVAYELDAFNVHSGGYGSGHYIAYRKICNQWIEVNDDTVRVVNNQEIDEILFGQKGASFTSYMHHYTCIPESQQQEVIAAPIHTSTAISTVSVSDIEKASLKKLTCQRAIEQLERLNLLLQTNASDLSSALQDLEKIAPKVALTLRHAIWLNGKTPDIHDYGAKVLNQNPSQLQEIKLPWLIAPIGANLIEQLLIVQRKKLEIAVERFKEAHLRSFLEKLKSPLVSNEELLSALRNLPEEVQNVLHGLVYHSHLKKFGKTHVNQEKYHREYGRLTLEAGDIRKTVTEASESVLNLWGKNIAEQLLSEYQIRAEKLRWAYEKEQLQGLHDLLLCPSSELSNHQLFKAFERLEIRPEVKEKLYWHIWYGHHSPSIPDYGSMTFRDNPHCLLGICEPNLARAPVCATGSNILFQLIKLLEKESR